MSNQEPQTKPDGGASVSTAGLGVVGRMRMALENAKPYVAGATWRGMAREKQAAESVLSEIESVITALDAIPIDTYTATSVLEFADFRISQLEAAIAIKDSALEAVIAADAECFDYTAALCQVQAALKTPNRY